MRLRTSPSARRSRAARKSAPANTSQSLASADTSGRPLVDQDALAKRPIDRRADRVAIRVDLSEVGDDYVDRHEGPDSSTDRTHECPSISRRNTFEHHQQVEVGVWAFLATSDRPEQDHLDRIERLDDLSNDERQRFAQRQAVVPARLVDYVQCLHLSNCTTESQLQSNGSKVVPLEILW